MHIALATCSNLPDWEIDDRPFHEALRNRGINVALVSWNDPAVQWDAFDACLIRTTWDYAEQRAAFIAWAERVEQCTQLFNPAAIVRWNTDKRYLRELADLGVPTIPTIWLERGTSIDLHELMQSRSWERGFIKPVVGAAARETMRFNSSTPDLQRAQQHVDRLIARESLQLQPYQPTVEQFGEVSAIFFNGAYSHGVRKVPVPGDYRTMDDFGAHDEPYDFSPNERAMIARSLAACGADELLYARIDMLRDADDKLRIIELELVEPSLFFRHHPPAAERLADALIERVRKVTVETAPRSSNLP